MGESTGLRDPKAEKFGAPVRTCIDRDKYLKLDAGLAVMRSGLDVESLNAQALKLKLKL
ncbi:hypothetical protein HETIRDRAFT_100305 [Heterobasidion irregulare TC 32-1]|uniref:Uncharacterized protein n=1 Tax=Heterobasidion irregulare (strain TC 32-1) TaxID=747525 RepID=W4KKB7_HETIT|nr:uncharacterized protein HETIRDRAFT_100305 [Heterobasidion irregulare TC 32-1]ETW86169.1 hypothetical protein HETIRDRAFT_100305 [Heterobasidion irregulare TC 32-1]